MTTPAEPTNTPADRHRAGRWILAVADLDRGQMADIIEELTAEPSTLTGFLFELGSMCIRLTDGRGDDWRNHLSLDLLELELTHPPKRDRMPDPDEDLKTAVAFIRAHLNDDTPTIERIWATTDTTHLYATVTALFTVVIRNSTSDTDAFCDALLLDRQPPTRRTPAAFIRSVLTDRKPA